MPLDVRNRTDGSAQTNPVRSGLERFAEFRSWALIGCRTVQKVAKHFGLQSRDHLAKDYGDLFGEVLRATLQISGGNGILCHPVSVAQSPQMAMARK